MFKLKFSFSNSEKKIFSSVFDKSFNFKKLNIFQPSHLLGERDKPQGHDVKLFEDITNFSGQFLFGPLKKFKNVAAEDIAELMAKKSSDSSNGVNIYTRLDI